MASREELRAEQQMRQMEQAINARKSRQLSKAIRRSDTAIARERTVGDKIRAEFPDGSSVNAGLLFNASYAQGGVYPAVQRDDGQWFLLNRNHQPVRIFDEDEEAVEESGLIKWLLASVRSSTNELIIRVGGHKEDPDIVLTLPFNPSTDRLWANFPTSAEQRTTYFGFKLDNTGPDEDDWIISYGKFTVNSYTVPAIPWQNSRTVTLYKVTPAGTEEILTETVLLTSDGAPTYNYHPVGHGGWLRRETQATSASDGVYTDRLTWNGSTYTATSDQDGAVFSGNTLIAPGQTRVTSGQNSLNAFSSYLAYGITFPARFLLSPSGSVSAGVYFQYFPGSSDPRGCPDPASRGFSFLRNTYFATGASDVFTPFNCSASVGNPFSPLYYTRDPNDPFNFYVENNSVQPTVRDDYLYVVAYPDTNPTYGINYGDRFAYDNFDGMLFSGTKEVSIHRWDVTTGIREASWQTVEYFGFTLPDGEYDVYPYDRTTLQIQYCPE